MVSQIFFSWASFLYYKAYCCEQEYSGNDLILCGNLLLSKCKPESKLEVGEKRKMTPLNESLTEMLLHPFVQKRARTG